MDYQDFKERLLFKTLSGSKLYGTNSETSDTDYKGVFLPDKEDLLLGKAPKHYNFTTSPDTIKNNTADIDETYYSLHYFLELLAAGETNCLDVFFANTNKNAVQYEDRIWTVLTQNADKVITKNINRYLGFCRSQAIKYSIKGEKLQNFLNFENILTQYIDTKDSNGAHVSLTYILNNHFKDFPQLLKNTEILEYKKNDTVIGKRVKLEIPEFGDHCYYVYANNNEEFLMISDIKFQVQDSVMDTLHKLKRTIKQFGERSAVAASNNGADHKALSHAVRVLFQAEELITTGKITFPLSSDKVKFIKEIKYNQTSMTYEEIVDYIDKRIQYINEELLPKSALPASADYKWIKSFILSLYQ